MYLYPLGHTNTLNTNFHGKSGKGWVSTSTRTWEAPIMETARVTWGEANTECVWCGNTDQFNSNLLVSLRVKELFPHLRSLLTKALHGLGIPIHKAWREVYLRAACTVWQDDQRVVIAMETESSLAPCCFVVPEQVRKPYTTCHSRSVNCTRSSSSKRSLFCSHETPATLSTLRLRHNCKNLLWRLDLATCWE